MRALDPWGSGRAAPRDRAARHSALTDSQRRSQSARMRSVRVVGTSGVLLAAALAGCDGSAPLAITEQALPWQPAEAIALLSITFDDAHDSQLAAARILEGEPGTAPEDSFRGTFFVVTGALRRDGDPAGRLTAADVQALADAGHEISGHTLNHLSLSALAAVDPYEARRQVCNDRRALQALGVQPVGFAYPKSDDDGAHDLVRDCGYAYARDAGGLVPPALVGVHAETVPPLDPFEIRVAPSIDAAAPAGDLRGELAKAAALEAWLEAIRDTGGGWLSITIHHLRDGCGALRYCMEESELRALVAWLRTHPPGIAVRTFDQVMVGDPLVANPSLEQAAAGTSPVRPACFKRVGLGSNFPAIIAPAPGRTGLYAEILRPTTGVPHPMIEIDPTGRGCAIPVTRGRRYDVRAFARAQQPPSAPPDATGTALARAVVMMQVDGQWLPPVDGPAIAVGDAWTPVSFITEPVPAGVTALAFGVRYADATGARPDLHVDDLSVVER